MTKLKEVHYICSPKYVMLTIFVLIDSVVCEKFIWRRNHLLQKSLNVSGFSVISYLGVVFDKCYIVLCVSYAEWHQFMLTVIISLRQQLKELS